MRPASILLAPAGEWHWWQSLIHDEATVNYRGLVLPMRTILSKPTTSADNLIAERAPSATRAFWPEAR